MSSISPISTQIALPQVASAAISNQGSGQFADILKSSIQTVESERAASDQAIQQFLTGESDDLHKIALATQRAELTSELFLQVRNKVISAYQEVMKLQM
jgi:flagellar hook-basal body complex protein FliE